MALAKPANRPIRLASVIPSLTAGGIGPVCRYAAGEIARQSEWAVSLLSLHDPPEAATDPATGLRTVSLGLDGDCAGAFLDWLSANPQDIIITSDVSRLEPAYPFLPPNTRHIVQVHDSGRPYRSVALRHAPWIDGVVCVARHIETRLGLALDRAGFQGLVRTVYNGARFPPLKPRTPHNGPLRLLFLGRVDPLKGVLDLAPLLSQLNGMGVPSVLEIVGGDNECLRNKLSGLGLDRMVAWRGRVPHDQCYEIASASDLLLMPSRKEAFGMVTIETMSMGCVPMAYDIPSGSTEIIEHGKSGLLIPLGNIRAWAEAIRVLSLDRARLAQMSATAIERARGAFNAELMARHMACFIREVIAHARRHPPQREAGLPPAKRKMKGATPQLYQRLPRGLRSWIRTTVGASPKLCHWWLNR